MGGRREGGGWVRSSDEAGQCPWSEGALLVRDASDQREGRGRVTTAPISLQDLRRRLYVKAKAELRLEEVEYGMAPHHARVVCRLPGAVLGGCLKALPADRSHNP